MDLLVAGGACYSRVAYSMEVLFNHAVCPERSFTVRITKGILHSSAPGCGSALHPLRVVSFILLGAAMVFSDKLTEAVKGLIDDEKAAAKSPDAGAWIGRSNPKHQGDVLGGEFTH